MSVVNMINKLKKEIPDMEIRKQLDIIKTEQILAYSPEMTEEELQIQEVKGWEATAYVINTEIAYPPENNWEYKVIALFYGVDMGDIELEGIGKYPIH